IEFDHVNLEFRKLLQDAFPDVEIVDIAQPSIWMRSIKSLEEQKLIREGAHVCDVGGAACVAAVKAGVAEHEVAIATTNAMIREIAKSHPYVELMDTWTWFQSGINTDGAHNPVTNRIVRSGDILSLNAFPMIFGYYTALERTLFCDHVDDASLDIWQKNVAVHRRGLELIKPGARWAPTDCCGAQLGLEDTSTAIVAVGGARANVRLLACSHPWTSFHFLRQEGQYRVLIGRSAAGSVGSARTPPPGRDSGRGHGAKGTVASSFGCEGDIFWLAEHLGGNLLDATSREPSSR
ncbi:M24 family metallopeptidase, partial [Mesorhizobium sp. ESP7-2]|uniref:M24 family metallopeptidase n=1 Tax=Mesorhizobium sp. ESP7-2 TaxID=2876622 RepID=UPI001CD03379